MDKTSKQSMENQVANESRPEDENALSVKNVFENENSVDDNYGPITLEEFLENKHHFKLLPSDSQLLEESIRHLEIEILELQTQGNHNFSTDDPVVDTEIVRHSDAYIIDLEEKKFAYENLIMEVTVAYAENPWKFFVNCDSGWGCPYRRTQMTENASKIVTREALEKSLTTYLFKNLNYKSMELKLKNMDYFEDQLVAVSLTRNENEKVFVRAYVKKDTCDEVGPNRKVEVQLLDTGENLEVNFEDVCLLPMAYVHGHPGLAYQCKLFGVSPLSSEWTPEASAYFSMLVVGKKCFLTVIGSYRTVAMCENRQNLFEFSNPYEVELRIRCENTECLRHHNVSELLAEKLHGVFWNSSPFCPDAEVRKSRS